MAEARSEQELAAVTHQLDAFHQTFNFCLTCRQYTCGDCWNDEDGRCLTCAPIPGRELPAHTHDIVAEAAVLEPEAEPAAADGADEAWPDADLSAGRLSRALGLDEAEVEATVDAVNGHEELVDHPGIAAAAVVAAASTPEPEPVEPELYEPELDLEPAPVAGLAPGQSLEDAIAAYEARLVGNEVAEVVEAAEVAAPEALAEPIEPDVVVAAAEIVDDPVEDEHDPLRAAMAAAALVATHEDHEHDAPVNLFAPEPEPVVGAVRSRWSAPSPRRRVAPSPSPSVAEPELLAEPARVDVVPQPVWPEPATSIDAPVAPRPLPRSPPRRSTRGSPSRRRKARRRSGRRRPPGPPPRPTVISPPPWPAGRCCRSTTRPGSGRRRHGRCSPVPRRRPSRRPRQPPRPPRSRA